MKIWIEKFLQPEPPEPLSTEVKGSEFKGMREAGDGLQLAPLISAARRGRKLVVTQNGRITLVPKGAQEGGVVCVLFSA